MASYTYPGVYIEELPSSVRSITGVGTSITAFIGRTRRGPLDEPTRINNFGDFERIFGGLWADSPLTYAVNDFYRNGGTAALIVRLFSPLFPTEAARDAAETQARNEATAAALAIFTGAQTAAGVAGARPAQVVTAVNNTPAAGPTAVVQRTRQTLLDAARAVAQTAATAASVAQAASGASVPAVADVANAGALAATAPNATEVTVHAAIQARAAAYADIFNAADAVADTAETANNDAGTDLAGLVAAVAARVGATTGADNILAAQAVQAAVAGAADKATAAANARAAVAPYEQNNTAAQAILTAANNDLNRVTAAWVRDAVDAARPAAIEAVAALIAPRPRARLAQGGLILEAKSAGDWGNLLKMRLTHENNDLFTLTILDGATGKIETHRRLSVLANDSRFVTEVLQNESALVLAATVPAARPAAHGAADRGEEFTTPGAFSAPNTAGGAAGSDGSVLNTAAYRGSPAGKTGLYALEKADLFNLLCIPPPAVDGVLDPQVYTDAAQYCQQRRAFLLMDPPSTWTTKDLAVAGFGPLATNIGPKSYAAMFFPNLRQPDPLRGDQIRDFPPCGAVAGVFARTDATRGVWKAPAGLEANLAGVMALSVPLTDAENGELNPLGLNCLRAFPAAGRVIWGARTLEGDDRLPSQWKYIPVRRLALFIEESLYRGTQWVVFEGNDERLWSQIRLNLGAFMNSLFRQGAFQGTSAKDSYFVKCDAETTTQTDINQGIVNIVVGFAPLKPAEFVVIKIQQIAGNIPT